VRSREVFFSQAASCLSVEGGGHARDGGARRGLRHDGVSYEESGEGGEWRERVVEKQREMNASLYLSEGPPDR
jgi:hypothetical protein